MQSTVSGTAPARTWRFPRIQLEDQIVLAAIAWVLTVVATFAIVLVVDRFFDVSISAWEIAVSVAHWYVGIICGWLMYVHVPLFVANGKTRRDATIETGITIGVVAVWVSFLMSVGYLIEELVYVWRGWSGSIDSDHLFSSRTDFGLILLENLLAFLVWAAVGSFVGISLYRSQNAGWLSLLPGALVLGLTGSFDRTDGGFFGIVTRFIPIADIASPVNATLISLVGAALAGGAAWLVARDMSLRNK